MDLRTARPLDVSPTVTINGSYDLNSQGSDNPEFDDNGSRYAIGFSQKFADDTIGLAMAYAVLAGWGVPAQRTVLMLAIVVALRLSARQWPWPAVWLTAMSAVLLLDPWAWMAPGFWLSFVAVAILFSAGRRSGDAPPQGLPWHTRLARAWFGYARLPVSICAPSSAGKRGTGWSLAMGGRWRCAPFRHTR